MNTYKVIEPVIDAVRTLRQGSTDVSIGIEPPYPAGFAFQVRYVYGSKENDSVVCQIALTQSSLFDGAEEEIWRIEDVLSRNLTDISRLLEGAMQELERFWTPEDLETAFLAFWNLPIDIETESIEKNFLHFPWGTACAKVLAWFDEKYPGGTSALYAWANKDLPVGKAYCNPLGDAIRRMDDAALAKLLFYINRQEHKFTTIEEVMDFLRMPAGQYITGRDEK